MIPACTTSATVFDAKCFTNIIMSTPNALNCIFTYLQISRNPGNWDGLVGVHSLGKTSITLKTCLRLLPAPSIEYFVFNVINARHLPHPPPNKYYTNTPLVTHSDLPNGAARVNGEMVRGHAYWEGACIVHSGTLNCMVHSGPQPAPRWELDGKFRDPTDFIITSVKAHSGKGLKWDFKRGNQYQREKSSWLTASSKANGLQLFHLMRSPLYCVKLEVYFS